MWMTDYIRLVREGLRDQHGFRPTCVVRGEPIFDHVPDGEYPMTIDGKVDHVRVEGGKISCCNFKTEKDSDEH